jgi:hypothetical protein
MIKYPIPFFLLCGTLFLAYLYIKGPGNGETRHSESAGAHSVSYTQLNQLKKETQIKLSMERERALLEKRRERNLLSPGARKRSRFHETPVGEMTDPRTHILDTGSEYQSLTLDQRMDAFLAQKQSFEMLEKVQKEAFVEQFIIEARKMGFNVKISEDLEVQSIDRIDGN